MCITIQEDLVNHVTDIQILSYGSMLSSKLKCEIEFQNIIFMEGVFSSYSCVF